MQKIKGECFECELEGKNCPNNLYSANDIYNSYKRCSCNIQSSNTLDKFVPKIKSD